MRAEEGGMEGGKRGGRGEEKPGGRKDTEKQQFCPRDYATGRVLHLLHPLLCFLSWKIIQAVPLLVFHMTKPHGSHLIILGAAWLPLPSSSSSYRAQQGCKPGHTAHPFLLPSPTPTPRRVLPSGLTDCGAGLGSPDAHHMEGPIRLMTCLVCTILMGEFPLFSLACAQNRIDAHEILGAAFSP